jgi:O-antigen/teichoic acid export membrane protein
MFWRGVWGYLPANVVQGVVGLLSIVAFTRLLSPADYGLYALGFSAMTLAHTSAFTWLEAAMARFWATASGAAEADAHMATIYGSFARVAVAFVALVAPALWLWPASRDVKFALAAGFAAVCARSLVKLVQERRRAAGEVTAAAGLDMLQTGAGFALGAACAALGFGGAAPLVGLALAALLCLPAFLPRELAAARAGAFDPARARAYAAYGFPVAASLILALALATADRFLIAWFLDAGSVGAYHAAYSLANRTLDVLFVWLGAAGAPALVHALERGGRAELDRAARDFASTMVAIVLPAAAGLALVAAPLAEVMVGEGLRAGAAAVTPWIAISALFSGLTTYYFHQAFTLARRTRLLIVAMVFPAVANIALNLILLPRFGLAGAAWAAAGSYAFGAMASWTFGQRGGGLPVPWATVAKAAAATATMALCVLAIPKVGGAVELFAKAGVGAFVYGLVAWSLDTAGVRTHGSQVLKGFRSRLAA